MTPVSTNNDAAFRSAGQQRVIRVFDAGFKVCQGDLKELQAGPPRQDDVDCLKLNVASGSVSVVGKLENIPRGHHSPALHVHW